MDPETTEAMLKRNLEKRGISVDDSMAWKVGASQLGGRGLFAVRDIRIGELICIDEPLLLGPRSRDRHLPICARCYKSERPLFPCDKGCGLPICSTACQFSQEHRLDCVTLRAWEPSCGSSWHVDFLRMLVPIRALLLDDEALELVKSFHWQDRSRHDSEINFLKHHIRGEINPQSEELMRRVCSVLDTNSFETVAIVDGVSTSLRGLYPMGAMMNHSCVPNTRHAYDINQRLYVYASLPIAKGEEITMTYTDLFWDTTLRRRHLAGTKKFSCCCKRCSDATEHGSFLGALKCADGHCDGILLPVEPLAHTTPWKCDECQLSVKNRQILSIRAGLGSIVEDLKYECPKGIIRFIDRELCSLVPSTNYVAIDIKLRMVSYLGRIDKFFWKDLSISELKRKARYCKELYELMDILGCGECKMKGLIAWELYCTRQEMSERQMGSFINELKSEDDVELFRTAKAILDGDATAPQDFIEALNTSR